MTITPETTLDADDRTEALLVARLKAGDQDAYEEINVQPAGSLTALNYGWPIMEGNACHDPAQGCDQTGLTLPVGGYSNARNVDDCSITGGRVYRGAAYPRLQGIYFYGDYCSSKIWGLKRQNGDILRDKILSRGFSMDAMTMFREFYGKDPDIGPLLEARGLTSGT